MPDGDIELKGIIDKLGNAFEEFKSTNDKQLAELKKGIGDAVTADKLAKINEELTKLQDAKDAAEKKMQSRIDEIEVRSKRPQLSGDETEKQELQVKSFNGALEAWDLKGQVDIDGLKAYKSNQARYLRKGHQVLSADEFKSMSVGGDPDGGFLVTPDVSGRIVQRIFDTSPIRQAANVQPIGTDLLEGINDLGEAGAGWVGETDTRPATDTPQVGKWKVPVHEMYAMPEATQKLLDDANVDVEKWLADKVAARLGRLENTAFVSGNGVAKPRGFTTYPTAATPDAARSWGNFEHIGTGVNGDFAASNPADALFDLEGAFKTGYLQGATFATRRSVVTKIRKFKGTDNQYLWQPGLQAGKPAQLIGYPILMAEDMPALGAGSLSLALGNFEIGYQIVDRMGIRVLRDPFTNKPYVRFYTTKRVGGDVVQFEAIKFIKFA